jgi:hypothetical protein
VRGLAWPSAEVVKSCNGVVKCPFPRAVLVLRFWACVASSWLWVRGSWLCLVISLHEAKGLASCGLRADVAPRLRHWGPGLCHVRVPAPTCGGCIYRYRERREKRPASRKQSGNKKWVYIVLQRETEEKARQPETKPSAIAQTRHTARLRDAKRSRTRNPKPTHGARDRPKQPQPRAGRARASEPGRRHSSRRTRPTDTGTRLFVNIDCYREGRETRLAVWAPKGEEQRPNVNERDAHETHPHETGTRHTHTGQPRRPPNRQPQTTAGCWRICQYRFTERRKKRPASRKQN